MSDRKAYLGDGLYVDIENGMFKLTAEDGIRSHQTVYLEPAVYSEFRRYADAALSSKTRAVDIDTQALLDAAWLARTERRHRKVEGYARFSSVSDASLDAIIDAASRALRGERSRAQ